MDFIKFSDQIDHLEEIICSVIDIVLANKEISGYLKALNPKLSEAGKTISSHSNSDAINCLNSQDPQILNESEKLHVFGNDIAESQREK